MAKKRKNRAQNPQRRQAEAKKRPKLFRDAERPRGSMSFDAEQAARLLGLSLERAAELEGGLGNHPALLRVSDIFDQFPRVAAFAQRRDTLEPGARSHEIQELHLGWRAPVALLRRVQRWLGGNADQTREAVGYLSLCASPSAILGQQGWKDLHEGRQDQIRLERAWSYLLEEPDEALALLGDLLKRHPEHPEALDLAAHACLYLDQPERAREAAEACLRVVPESAESRSRCRRLLAWLDDIRKPAGEAPEQAGGSPLEPRLAHLLERLKRGERTPHGVHWTADLVTLSRDLAESTERYLDGESGLHPFLWDELVARLRNGALIWPNTGGYADPVGAIPWELRYRLDRAACLAELEQAPQDAAATLLCALIKRRRSIVKAAVTAVEMLPGREAMARSINDWLVLSPEQPLALGLSLYDPDYA